MWFLFSVQHLGPIRLPSVFMHHQAYQQVKRSDQVSVPSSRIASANAAAVKSSATLKDASLQEQVSNHFISFSRRKVSIFYPKSAFILFVDFFT